MTQKTKISKAELGRELGVSRAYITMMFNGKRKPSKNIVNKIEAIYGYENVNNNEFNAMTLNQQFTGSTPVRLTT